MTAQNPFKTTQISTFHIGFGPIVCRNPLIQVYPIHRGPTLHYPIGLRTVKFISHPQPQSREEHAWSAGQNPERLLSETTGGMPTRVALGTMDHTPTPRVRTMHYHATTKRITQRKHQPKSMTWLRAIELAASARVELFNKDIVGLWAQQMKPSFPSI